MSFLTLQNYRIRNRYMKMSFKKLNQNGFDHILMAVAFIVVIGVAGTYLLLAGHAAASTVELRLTSNNATHCINGTTLTSCSAASGDDVFSAMSGTFQIKDMGGNCITDTGGVQTKTLAAGGTRVPVRVASCGSSSTQKWSWAGGGELKNAASGGCINDLGDSTASNNQLIIYSCNGAANEIWKEVAVTYTGKTGTSGSGGSTSSTGLVRTTSKTAALVFWNIVDSQGVHMCLDDYQDAGSRVDAYQCNGAASQTWAAVNLKQSGSTTELGNIENRGKCLTANGTATGSAVVLSTCNGSTSQEWEVAYPNVSYLFGVSDKCVTDPGASKTNGTNLVLSVAGCKTSPLSADEFGAATPLSSTSKS
jgi:hypothetical protein